MKSCRKLACGFTGWSLSPTSLTGPLPHAEDQRRRQRQT
jgi:hypothetical protein